MMKSSSPSSPSLKNNHLYYWFDCEGRYDSRLKSLWTKCEHLRSSKKENFYCITLPKIPAFFLPLHNTSYDFEFEMVDHHISIYSALEPSEFQSEKLGIHYTVSIQVKELFFIEDIEYAPGLYKAHLYFNPHDGSPLGAHRYIGYFLHQDSTISSCRLELNIESLYTALYNPVLQLTHSIAQSYLHVSSHLPAQIKQGIYNAKIVIEQIDFDDQDYSSEKNVGHIIALSHLTEQLKKDIQRAKKLHIKHALSFEQELEKMMCWIPFDSQSFSSSEEPSEILIEDVPNSFTSLALPPSNRDQDSLMREDLPFSVDLESEEKGTHSDFNSPMLAENSTSVSDFSSESSFDNAVLLLSSLSISPSPKKENQQWRRKMGDLKSKYNDLMSLKNQLDHITISFDKSNKDWYAFIIVFNQRVYPLWQDSKQNKEKFYKLYATAFDQHSSHDVRKETLESLSEDYDLLFDNITNAILDFLEDSFFYSFTEYYEIHPSFSHLVSYLEEMSEELWLRFIENNCGRYLILLSQMYFKHSSPGFINAFLRTVFAFDFDQNTSDCPDNHSFFILHLLHWTCTSPYTAISPQMKQNVQTSDEPIDLQTIKEKMEKRLPIFLEIEEKPEESNIVSIEDVLYYADYLLEVLRHHVNEKTHPEFFNSFHLIKKTTQFWRFYQKNCDDMLDDTELQTMQNYPSPILYSAAIGCLKYLVACLSNPFSIPQTTASAEHRGLSYALLYLTQEVDSRFKKKIDFISPICSMVEEFADARIESLLAGEVSHNPHLLKMCEDLERWVAACERYVTIISELRKKNDSDAQNSDEPIPDDIEHLYIAILSKKSVSEQYKSVFLHKIKLFFNELIDILYMILAYQKICGYNPHLQEKFHQNMKLLSKIIGKNEKDNFWCNELSYIFYFIETIQNTAYYPTVSGLDESLYSFINVHKKYFANVVKDCFEKKKALLAKNVKPPVSLLGSPIAIQAYSSPKSVLFTSDSEFKDGALQEAKDSLQSKRKNKKKITR